jgi:hypothetical protein
MTENEAQKNQEQQVKNTDKKKQFFLTKLVVLIALIFFGFLGFKYWQHTQFQKHGAQNSTGKIDGDNDIFDVSSEYKNQQSEHSNEAHDLSDLSLDELREKGVEFIYQTLVKNQLQINDLKEQIQGIKAEIVKNKSQERLSKMILTYIDLRQRIFNEMPYEEALKNFEILVAVDENLQKKVEKLKPLLADFSTQKKLQKSFTQLIPNLIANKVNKGDTGLISKLRQQVSKLVLVRRIDGKDPTNVDGIIAQTEKYLATENYQEAFDSLLTLDQTYHQILADFLNSLSIAIEVQKTDQEIFYYLKNLI